MDRLIIDLYEKNIIQIKRTELKNGLTIPLYINFYSILEYPRLLELFLIQLNNFIINKNLNYNCIYGKNEFCKIICTLLSYKFNYKNIIKENIYLYKNDEEKNCLFIKENMGLSSKTLNNISKLNSYNINVKETLVLVNFNTNKSHDNSVHFLDIYSIIQVLYKEKILNYDKFIYLFFYLSNNTYMNFNERLLKTNNSFKPIFESIIKKKSLLFFCTNVLQKLEFKELIVALDFVGNHVSIVMMSNLEKYSELEIKSLIKLCMHHNFKILSSTIFDKINFIKKVSIFDILNDVPLDKCLYIVDDTISNNRLLDKSNTLSVLQTIKNNENILGIITNEKDFLQENKLKIYNIRELEDNVLENKLIKESYDNLIVNSTETLVSLKHLSWNLYEKKNKS